MKKGNATLVLIALIAFTVLTWVGVVKGEMDAIASYNEYISKAESFEKKEIYIDAVEYYEKALELKNNDYDIIMKIANIYYKLENYTEYISYCDSAIKASPDNPEPYLKKTEYYMSKSDFTEAVKVVKNANDSVKNNDKIKKLQKELSTKCVEKYTSYTDINDWHVQNNTNYIGVGENDKWGIAEKDGKKKIKLKFEYVGAYDSDSGVIPCCLDGLYYYMDINGNKKLVGDNVYQYLGSFGNGLAPAQRENKFGYIDKEFNEQKFEFEYAGSFANNVAAVKQNGKWALINNKLQNITGFDYDEILMDSNGYCSVYNVIIARKDNKYLFLNHNGGQIGNQTFDGAAMPASNDLYIAVKQGSKWGFADQNGNIVIEAKYNGAKSFSLGLAPISEGDTWGYINTEGKVVIEAKYKEAGVFSSDGSAPVKDSSNYRFLVLCEYDN